MNWEKVKFFGTVAIVALIVIFLTNNIAFLNRAVQPVNLRAAG